MSDIQIESHQAAHAIMGKNFLGLAEVAKVFGALRPESRTALAVIPFDEATLKACAETHVLVADLGPSIIDVRARFALNFGYDGDFRYDFEEFATRTEPVAWRLMRRAPVPESENKTWDEQKVLVGEPDEVPTNRQVVYATMLAFATTGECMFEWMHVRTCDGLNSGIAFRVCVGFIRLETEDLKRDILGIQCWGDSERYDNLGVASSRKPLIPTS